MEGDEGLRTVECLRGRLLAERQASRVAKQNAVLMDKRLIELENQLKEEIKLKEKAEKKLRFLMKKLESFKRLSKLEGSEKSSSSETSAISCVSSASASDSKEQEEQKPECQITNPETSQDSDHGTIKKKETSRALNAHASKEENSSPRDAKNTDIKGHEEPKTAQTRSSNHSTEKMRTNRGSENPNDDDDDVVDNSMALVPVDLPAETKRDIDEPKLADKSVDEVLDALRHARERIQSSLETRTAYD